jgi:hypothetical protein
MAFVLFAVVSALLVVGLSALLSKGFSDANASKEQGTAFTGTETETEATDSSIVEREEEQSDEAEQKQPEGHRTLLRLSARSGHTMDSELKNRLHLTFCIWWT